jgi:hypothetical protein
MNLLVPRFKPNTVCHARHFVALPPAVLRLRSGEAGSAAYWGRYSQSCVAPPRNAAAPAMQPVRGPAGAPCRVGIRGTLKSSDAGIEV